MRKEAFWTERLRTHGHTGWADPVIYPYDQLERLALVEATISKSHVARGAALDFGCGTGDFSRLLFRLGFDVFGYDPFVRPNINSENFKYSNTYEGIPLENNTAALVVSITTLDHILKEQDLLEALGFIRRVLKKTGIFLLLEYAVDSTADRERLGLKNSYQSFRTLAEWRTLLAQTAFKINDVLSVPHPLFSPSPGYSAYMQTPIARLRKRCGRLPLARHWYDPLLWRRAAKLIEEYPPASDANVSTPLKLLVCSAA